jgi:hypothetical protein
MSYERFEPSDTSDDDKAREILQDTGNMNLFMNGMFGAGNWVFDETEDVWVTSNSKGPGYIVFRRGGDWFVADIPEREMS